MRDYELPYRNYFQDKEFGVLPNRNAICRDNTASVFLAQGVGKGEHPENSIIWALAGNPIGCIVTGV